MQPIITARLKMRPFVREDEEAAFAFFSDLAVMRFSLNGPHASRKSTVDFIRANANRQMRTGYSFWAVEEESSGRVIGMCGLAAFGHGISGIELAYRLHHDSWGKGYGSEAAGSAVAYGFTELQLDRLIAAVEPANVASVRVLEKTGFSRISRRSMAGRDAFLFEQTRNDWLARQIQVSAGMPVGLS
jgi:ribosomal-protein-alanine N-acetyltransferase